MNRVNFFDALKAILMVDVVAGHIISNGLLFGDTCDTHWLLFNIRIAISMPLFFMISGFFARRWWETELDWHKIVFRIVCLLWPLFSFGAIFGLISYFLGEKTIAQTFVYPFRHIIYGGWFLSCLATCFAIVALVCYINKNMIWRVLLCIAIMIVLIFAPRTMYPFCWMRVDYTIHMLPYFMFGTFFFHDLLYRNIKYMIFFGVVFIMFILFEGSAMTNGLNFYRASLYWRDLNAYGMFCFIARPFFGVVGCVFVLGLFYRLETIFPKVIKMVAIFGTTTLGVYVMHQWPLIKIGEYCGIVFPLPIGYGWVLAVPWLIICHYCTLLIRKNQWARMAFFGDEKLLAKLFGCERR